MNVIDLKQRKQARTRDRTGCTLTLLLRDGCQPRQQLMSAEVLQELYVRNKNDIMRVISAKCMTSCEIAHVCVNVNDGAASGGYMSLLFRPAAEV